MSKMTSTANVHEEIPPSNYRSAKKLLVASFACSFFLLAPAKNRTIDSKYIRFDCVDLSF